MAVLLCHCLTILWILGCVLVSSDARVLSKSCNNVESITLVNSTHLFGLPVECRDDCVLFAVSSSSVETCKEASDAKEVVDWKRCESSTASSLLVRSNDQVRTTHTAETTFNAFMYLALVFVDYKTVFGEAQCPYSTPLCLC